MPIYQPAEDSYLLSETLKEFLKNNLKIKKINQELKILDMGSGSSIQAQTCKELGFKNILCVDINKEAVKNLKKQGFNAIHSDLFSNLKKQKFDLIIFNPPYLPEHRFDKEKDTTGGKQGFETIVDFLTQAKDRLNDKASIILLFSSLSQPKVIIEKAKSLGYNTKLLSSESLFFEELYVYETR